MLDEVEQALVGPLHILEDQNERVLFGERFEEAPPRCERLFLRARDVRGLADERTQMRQDPVRVFLDQLLDGVPSFAATSSSLSVSRMPACAFTISPAPSS